MAAFGLVAGWLTWRTAGLEAAIAFHVANNAVLVALGGAGLVDLTTTAGSLSGLVVSLVLLSAYAWRVRTWGGPQCSSVLRESVSVIAPAAAMTPTTTASTP